jgi:hypothetical protein
VLSRLVDPLARVLAPHHSRQLHSVDIHDIPVTLSRPQTYSATAILRVSTISLRIHSRQVPWHTICGLRVSLQDERSTLVKTFSSCYSPSTFVFRIDGLEDLLAG